MSHETAYSGPRDPVNAPINQPVADSPSAQPLRTSPYYEIPASEHDCTKGDVHGWISETGQKIVLRPKPLSGGEVSEVRTEKSEVSDNRSPPTQTLTSRPAQRDLRTIVKPNLDTPL